MYGYIQENYKTDHHNRAVNELCRICCNRCQTVKQKKTHKQVLAISKQSEILQFYGIENLPESFNIMSNIVYFL